MIDDHQTPVRVSHTMNQPGINPYLRTRVMTASTEQLRLMLFEGAIKFCHQGKKAIETRDFEKSYENLTRAQSILLELSSSLNREEDSELCERLTALYHFMYRRLIDASMHQDPGPIEEVINLLNYERDTWQLVIDRAMEERAQQASQADAAPPPPSPPRPAAAAYGPPKKPAVSRLSQSA